VCINAGKCANVTFTNRVQNCPLVSLNGRALEHSLEHKYLGVTLDRCLTFEKQVAAALI